MNFKKLNQFVIAIMVFFQVNAQSNVASEVSLINPEQGLKITGEIPGLEENEVVSIFQYEFSNFDGKMKWTPLDTAIVKNGKFFLQYRFNDGPRLLLFTFSKHQSNLVATMLGNEEVRMSAKLNLSNMSAYNPFLYYYFEGSNSANDFVYSRAVKSTWINSVQGVKGEIQRFKDSTTLSKHTLNYINGLISAKAEINKAISYIMGGTASKKSAGLCEIFTEGTIDFQMKFDSLWYRCYNNLDQEVKSSYYGKILQEYLPLLVGQKAPDFPFVNVDGKSGSLQKAVQSNKLTLLYFWSTDALEQERLKFNDDLINRYKKYHPKGFEIVNVFLDGNTGKWKKLVNEEKIPGFHTIDSDGEMAKAFKIEKNDMYTVLIDETGKIIAWEVYGPELYGYLYKLLGE
jgi:hypothetical protein